MLEATLGQKEFVKIQLFKHFGLADLTKIEGQRLSASQDCGVGPYDLTLSFRRTRDAFVLEDFRPQMVKWAQPSQAVPPFRHITLTDHMTEDGVEQMLGRRHTFDATEVSALIASLVCRQWFGESGELLSCGRCNFFYLDSCVVGVHWSKGHYTRGAGRWVARVWDRHSSIISAGSRAFARGDGV